MKLTKSQFRSRFSTFEHHIIFQLNDNHFIILNRFHRVFFHIIHMQKLQIFAIQVLKFFSIFMFKTNSSRLLIEQQKESVFAALAKMIRISFSSFVLCSDENKEHAKIVRFDIMHICAI